MFDEFVMFCRATLCAGKKSRSRTGRGQLGLSRDSAFSEKSSLAENSAYATFSESLRRTVGKVHRKTTESIVGLLRLVHQIRLQCESRTQKALVLFKYILKPNFEI